MLNLKCITGRRSTLQRPAVRNVMQHMHHSCSHPFFDMEKIWSSGVEPGRNRNSPEWRSLTPPCLGIPVALLLRLRRPRLAARHVLPVLLQLLTERAVARKGALDGLACLDGRPAALMNSALKKICTAERQGVSPEVVRHLLHYETRCRVPLYNNAEVASACKTRRAGAAGIRVERRGAPDGVGERRRLLRVQGRNAAGAPRPCSAPNLQTKAPTQAHCPQRNLVRKSFRRQAMTATARCS